MENMQIYNAVRKVPKSAKREIKGGRLNGKTDINPMWRIKTLTEQFGACGFGWRYEITDKRLESSVESAEMAAFVDINLYVKADGEWSEAIPGTGGSSFISKEKNGLYMSDECYKMALTDALSVACKALGIGADVYWDKDTESKYGAETPKEGRPSPMDVFDMPGADQADNKTLFFNALRIAGLSNEQGADILKDMFGQNVKVNDLEEADFCNLIAALGE